MKITKFPVIDNDITKMNDLSLDFVYNPDNVTVEDQVTGALYGNYSRNAFKK